MELNGPGTAAATGVSQGREAEQHQRELVMQGDAGSPELMHLHKGGRNAALGATWP